MQSISPQRDHSASPAPLPAAGGRVVEVDVRDDLRNGREPFQRIMSAVAGLQPADVLHLRATFEPVPLFRVLGKRGYAHVAREEGPDDWSVWFHHPADASAAGDAAAVPTSAPLSASPTAATPAAGEVVLDVRGLEPPEPMVRTLAALESLPSGAVLVQHNERVPQFLLPILTERGFHYEVDDAAPDRVVVRIRRADLHPHTTPTSTAMQTNELDVRVIPPREKHPTIFRTFDALASGQAMVIVNDHDPRPLRYQLAAERPDSFEWTYLEEGPETWRVRIDRR